MLRERPNCKKKIHVYVQDIRIKCSLTHIYFYIKIFNLERYTSHINGVIYIIQSVHNTKVHLFKYTSVNIYNTSMISSINKKNTNF